MCSLRAWGICLLLAMAPGAMADAWTASRLQMVRAIEEDVRATSWQIGRRELQQSVMAVMGEVPRHRFVPLSMRPMAYLNRPLPIGHGQTISQPYIVALMTDLLQPDADDVMLEIGTGSGYQAAVLSRLVRKVYSIEIIPELGESAGKRIAELGYDNVHTRTGDGYYGWPEVAPFDGIVVTAAAGHVPPPLVRQLRVGARMIIPVGDRFSVQHLLLVEKHDEDSISTRQVLPVRFVPLTGTH